MPTGQTQDQKKSALHTDWQKPDPVSGTLDPGFSDPVKAEEKSSPLGRANTWGLKCQAPGWWCRDAGWINHAAQISSRLPSSATGSQWRVAEAFSKVCPGNGIRDCCRPSSRPALSGAAELHWCSTTPGLRLISLAQAAPERCTVWSGAGLGRLGADGRQKTLPGDHKRRPG